MTKTIDTARAEEMMRAQLALINRGTELLNYLDEHGFTKDDPYYMDEVKHRDEAQIKMTGMQNILLALGLQFNLLEGGIVEDIA